jgi:hypothetical protein
MPVHPDRPIAIYHEHPDWFRPLFTELNAAACRSRGWMPRTTGAGRRPPPYRCCSTA